MRHKQSNPIGYYLLPPSLERLYAFLDSESRTENFSPYQDPSQQGQQRNGYDAVYQEELWDIAQQAEAQLVTCAKGNDAKVREEDIPIARPVTDICRNAGALAFPLCLHIFHGWADTESLKNGGLDPKYLTEQLADRGMPLFSP